MWALGCIFQEIYSAKRPTICQPDLFDSASPQNSWLSRIWSAPLNLKIFGFIQFFFKGGLIYHIRSTIDIHSFYYSNVNIRTSRRSQTSFHYPTSTNKYLPSSLRHFELNNSLLISGVIPWWYLLRSKCFSFSFCSGVRSVLYLKQRKTRQY